MGKVRVGINGYGVIGKRIADAVILQDDKEKLINSGFKVQGVLADLLGTVDVVVDATPAGVGKENKKMYDAARVKSIFQGGEEHELTGLSFVAEANYEKALGKESVRVVPIKYKDGVTAENQLVELMRDMGRPRADMWAGRMSPFTIRFTTKQSLRETLKHPSLRPTPPWG